MDLGTKITKLSLGGRTELREETAAILFQKRRLVEPQMGVSQGWTAFCHVSKRTYFGL